MMEIDKNKNVVKKSGMKIEWAKDKDNNANGFTCVYTYTIYLVSSNRNFHW